MSSAFYPQGMNSWNNRLHQGGYKTWKGSGQYQNPIGITTTHIRPLTNKDSGNIFPTKMGLPRPIKHYRKGRNIPTFSTVFTPNVNQQIDYNINRAVKSANGQNLGGGGGGSGLISNYIDTPGSVSVQNNQNICANCVGVSMVSNWYPINNLTDKPQANVTNCVLCCNQQRKALNRVRPASTIVKKNYYQTSDMYLYNRCQTFKQRSFNFVTNHTDNNNNVKPGEPLSETNLYVAQCNPNILEPSVNVVCGEVYVEPADNNRSCGQVYYKPNNPQFAQQGAVSSSTRLLKLNVDTISTNEALNNRYNSVSVSESNNNIPFIYKMKTQQCNLATYHGNPFFFQGQPSRHTICTSGGNL